MIPPGLAEWEEHRIRACRLLPDRALVDLDEAEAWVRERGLVTRAPGLWLPSLHAACHEEPYDPGKRGFATWPRTKWWWGQALAERSGLRWLKILGGTGVLVTDGVAALVGPLAEAELERADAGGRGDAARRLAAHLAAAGPSFTNEVREELGLSAKALRSTRERLEQVGAVVARRVAIGEDRHATELARWDQVFETSGRAADAGALLAAGVDAAVLAPEAEARRWFSWAVSADRVDELVRDGRLGRAGNVLFSPASGW